MTIRYSFSAIVGTIITAALFLGMLSLLKQKPVTINSDDMDINFSFVKDYKEPIEEIKSPREIPEPKETTQPPSAPTLNVNVDNTPSIDVPLSGFGKNPPNLIKGISLPGFGIGQTISSNNGLSGAIKTAISPIYPPPQLMKKTEGWVQAKISVNEFGSVDSISIIAAKPNRVFDAAAKKAIKKWKFHPKIVDGKAIPFTATQTIEFKIDQ